MKLAIMQPYFFPYIGYWQLIHSVSKFVIFDDVNFINKGWVNRNRILNNGNIYSINIQLNNASQNKLINEIEVLNNNKNKDKLLKTIRHYYSKAPYFSEIFMLVEDIINNKESNLSRYLEYNIRSICQYLSIDTELFVSSTIEKNNSLKGQTKIIEICKILNAGEYYNAIGGQALLYDSGSFNKEGIKLKFLQTRKIEYKHNAKHFVPNLSIIDVMMFNSVEEINNMLEEYDLIEDV